MEARAGVAPEGDTMSRVVAVIGASSDRAKYGNKAVRAFAHQGYTVVPIHPREEAVEGFKAYKSVLDVPGPIDMATMYVAPAMGMRVIEEVAQKGIPEVWLNPGADSPELAERARALGLRTVVACSILGVGENPQAL
jgi:predicted CoA-binding protein